MQHPLLSAMLFFLISNSAIAADSTDDLNRKPAPGERFPGVKKLMSAEEWRASGLDKLSAGEIKALDAWLIRYTARDAAIIQNSVAEVKEEADKDIHSSIDGRFSGWDGNTVFRLKNGQVWQQRNRGRWRTDLVNPKVIITRNFFGFYEMKVVEADRLVGVKRLQ